MQSNVVVNIILAAIALILVIVIWLSGDNPPTTSTTPTLGLKTQSTQITIDHPGEISIKLRSAENGWQVRHNTADEKWVSASNWKIEQILDGLKKSHPRFITEDKKQAGFGLAETMITLHLGEQVIDFGDTDPIKHRRYIRVNRNIYTIDDNIYRHLIDDYYDFVDKYVLPPQSKITAIRGESFHIQRDENGKWQSSLNNDQLSADHVQRLIDEWTHLSAISVTKGHPVAHGHEIQFTFENHPPLLLKIKKEPTQLIIYNADTMFEYQVSSHLLARLIPTEKR